MNRSVVFRLAVLLTLTTTIPLLIGCGSESAPSSEPGPLETNTVNAIESDPLATAAAQATTIVREAQATALVLQAETEAQATIQAAADAQPTADSSGDEGTGPAAALSPTAVAEATVVIPIEVLSVGFAAEGGMIQVRFRAPVEVADRWLQGQVYLIDEANGLEYKEIPVMPRIGPLFGKPAREGQTGYFMLVNAPQPLQPGATVTVILGNHVEEGITVQ